MSSETYYLINYYGDYYLFLFVNSESNLFDFDILIFT